MTNNTNTYGTNGVTSVTRRRALQLCGMGVATATAGFGAGTAAAAEYDREFVDVDGVFENADGLVSSLTLGPDEGTGTIAAVFPSGETPQRAAIENEVGTSASSRDIEIDDTRVSINGIWRVPDEESDD
mgnify:CR=1 FL=1